MIDPAMSQTLMAMLPVEVRSALEGGASPEEVAQSLLMQRLQQGGEEPRRPSSESDEPWPELGWSDRPARRPSSAETSYDAPTMVAVPEPADDRLAALARALGACTLCLGENFDCPVCGGTGTPGWSIPEPHLFEMFVMPALRRLEAEELRQAQAAARRFASPPPPESSNDHSANN